MIGSLRGKIIYKNHRKIEIDVSGVGYEIFLSAHDLAKTKLDKEIEVFTFHHLAENTNTLYGFLSRTNKTVFEMLISVSGVGPKTAMEVFSAGDGERILRAVSEADVEFFQQVKGLGKKGAQRIIVDLKSKVGDIKELDLESGIGGREVVYQALQSLGFSRKEIVQSLRELPKDLESEDEIIKYALRRLGQNG
ncbi:Holliday junction branch migration protein RuvA [Candidatus Microgenomates bacterium]|nr:Holliday junction branch migration protein RuvA [Candidatus Microgenomates bacterium]